MLFRILFCLGIVMTVSCTPAKMAVDPGLAVNAVNYLITERPRTFSDDDLVFGPYRATRINRSFVSGNSQTTLGFTSKNAGQDYSYHFKGQGSWRGNCFVESGNLEYKIVSGGYFADIHCSFVPVENESGASEKWNFNISGETSGTAHGEFSSGSESIAVVAINKIEGSSLRLSQHTGYYFYLGERIVAGVDTISRDGPVWINKNLTDDQKDAIGLVVVALLLNQT